MDNSTILVGISTLLIIIIMGYMQHKHSVKRGNDMVKKYSKSLMVKNNPRDL